MTDEDAPLETSALLLFQLPLKEFLDGQIVKAFQFQHRDHP
ncbi:MAG: hypothetical protein QOJ15_3761 [Bradyrhizobium sp.]|jgi:hypothetical protein|nr:hypothetical protein [Bradyrhizobium sp.]